MLFVGTGLLLLIPVMTRRRAMYVIPLILAYAITGLVGFYTRYYSSWEERIYPGIRVLSDPSALPPDFRLIWKHEPSKTLVYEVGTGR